jgi:NAD(P)-dependent dehydrogenase (short-subunit alcohol dehydrogenase family)
MVQSLPEAELQATDQSLIHGQALHRRGQPEEVAKTIGFLLGDDSSFITGSVIVIDGGQVC